MKFKFLVMAAALSGSAIAATPAPARDASGMTGSVEERLSRVERMLQAGNQVQIDLQQQLSDLETEVGTLRGAVELHTHQIEQILNRQRDLYQDIDRRLGQASAPATAAATPVETDDAPLSSPDVAANVAYETAFNLLKSKRRDDAAKAFGQFVADFPQSSYAPNAYYWQGQISFHQNKLDEATKAFSLVVNQFPKSSKRAECIFKLGLIAEKQGDQAGATQLFKQVIAEYPTSSVAQMAKSRL